MGRYLCRWTNVTRHEGSVARRVCLVVAVLALGAAAAPSAFADNGIVMPVLPVPVTVPAIVMPAPVAPPVPTVVVAAPAGVPAAAGIGLERGFNSDTTGSIAGRAHGRPAGGVGPGARPGGRVVRRHHHWPGSSADCTAGSRGFLGCGAGARRSVPRSRRS